MNDCLCPLRGMGVHVAGCYYLSGFSKTFNDEVKQEKEKFSVVYIGELAIYVAFGSRGTLMYNTVGDKKHWTMSSVQHQWGLISKSRSVSASIKLENELNG